MARHTSLYQAPRSPLIQGRTRWERPLWQAWLVGALVGLAAAAGSLVALVRSHPGAAVDWESALLYLGLSVVLGSLLGAVLARLFGWRQRWLGAVLLALVALGLVWAIMTLMQMPLLLTIELVR